MHLVSLTLVMSVLFLGLRLFRQERYSSQQLVESHTHKTGVSGTILLELPPHDGNPRRALLTGAAGFIGAHLALRLQKNGWYVIGVDDFNDYYDPRLKWHRFRRLQSAGITVIRGSYGDRTLLDGIFGHANFTHVAHIGAQAGVRKSISSPEAYVSRNLMDTVALMEVVRRQDCKPVVVYASSSSVYGNSGVQPFSEEQIINEPRSLYAATKIGMEALMSYYHYLYDIRVTGLRFFTVYGPMGRPDMAIWLWTHSMVTSGEVIYYVQKDGTGMRRDFTYIDDIIDGVEAALKLGLPYRVLNLGRGKPQPISHVIEVLEGLTGKKARLVTKQMSDADVASTHCNVTLANRLLGYEPVVTVEEGVRRFYFWYLEYQKEVFSTWIS